MKILIAGASGFVGTALSRALNNSGNEVYSLTRKVQPNLKNTILWDPKRGKLDFQALEGFDAMINLSGENIGSTRWTTAKKKAILESRTTSTALLSTSISKLKSPPKVLVNASAIGYYGNRGDEILNESSMSGETFLAKVCRSWEAAAAPAKSIVERVIFLRTGVVFSSDGGALKKMLLPFKLGLGGRIGSGNQYVSWIALEDLVGIIIYCLNSEKKETPITGPVNAVAPLPVTNAELTKILGEVLGRPTFLPVPAALIRFLLGEMGEELLLNSTRVQPQKLLTNGYVFLHPELKKYLQSQLK